MSMPSYEYGDPSVPVPDLEIIHSVRQLAGVVEWAGDLSVAASMDDSLNGHGQTHLRAAWAEIARTVFYVARRLDLPVEIPQGSTSSAASPDMQTAVAESDINRSSLTITGRDTIDINGQLLPVAPQKVDILAILAEHPGTQLDSKALASHLQTRVGIRLPRLAVARHANSLTNLVNTQAGTSLITWQQLLVRGESRPLYGLDSSVGVELASGVESLIESRRIRYQALFSPDSLRVAFESKNSTESIPVVLQNNNELLVGDQRIQLSAHEVFILNVLQELGGHATRRDFLELGFYGHANVLDTALRGLSKKLNGAGSKILCSRRYNGRPTTFINDLVTFDDQRDLRHYPEATQAASQAREAAGLAEIYRTVTEAAETVPQDERHFAIIFEGHIAAASGLDRSTVRDMLLWQRLHNALRLPLPGQSEASTPESYKASTLEQLDRLLSESRFSGLEKGLFGLVLGLPPASGGMTSLERVKLWPVDASVTTYEDANMWTMKHGFSVEKAAELWKPGSWESGSKLQQIQSVYTEVATYMSKRLAVSGHK